MNFKTFCCLFILCSGVVLSCQNQEDEKKPAGLIPEEKFAEILVDIRLLEGAYAQRFQEVDTSVYKIDSYYEQLFSKHQITRSAFLESNQYYALHPDVLIRIENKVAAKLDSLPADQPFN